MSGHGVLGDEGSEPRKPGMGESSYLDYKSILKDRLMKDIWDARDPSDTGRLASTHISDFLFSDIPLIKGSCSCLALLCCVWMFWGKSILPAFPPARGDKEVIYNPLQLRRTRRMELPSFASAELRALCPGSPLAVERDTGGTRVPRQRKDDFCPSTRIPAPGLPVTELCVQRDRRTGHPITQMKTPFPKHLTPRPTKRHLYTPTGS